MKIYAVQRLEREGAVKGTRMFLWLGKFAFFFPTKRKEGAILSYLTEVWTPQTFIKSATQRKALWGLP